MPLQIRRGLDSEREAKVFADGEIVFSYPDTGSKNDGRLYIGDGETLGGVQVTGFTGEDAIDAVGAALAGGTHQNISFTYGSTQDLANRIDATVSLSTLLEDLNLNGYNIIGTGNISIEGGIVSDLVGSVFADDSTTLVDSVAGVLRGQHIGSLTGNVTGNLTGDVTGNLTGNVVGNVTGNTDGYHTGDVKGSIFGDDSSLIVDGLYNAVFASGGLTGDLNADNIYANDSGIGLNIRSKIGNSFCVDYYDGTKDSPVAITAGNNVGAISIKGWNGSEYAFAGTVYADWEATANTATDYPASTLVLAAGNNSGSPVTASLNSVGTFSAPTIQTGVYTDTPDTKPTGVKGMIIFNDTTGKFQGFDGSTWVDLS